MCDYSQGFKNRTVTSARFVNGLVAVAVNIHYILDCISNHVEEKPEVSVESISKSLN